MSEVLTDRLCRLDGAYPSYHSVSPAELAPPELRESEQRAATNPAALKDGSAIDERRPAGRDAQSVAARSPEAEAQRERSTRAHLRPAEPADLAAACAASDRYRHLETGRCLLAHHAADAIPRPARVGQCDRLQIERGLRRDSDGSAPRREIVVGLGPGDDHPVAGRVEAHWHRARRSIHEALERRPRDRPVGPDHSVAGIADFIA